MKKLAIILLALTICSVSASELDFGYSESNGIRVINVKNKVPFKTNGVDVTPTQIFESSNQGNLFNFSVNATKQVDKKVDFFADVDYLDDEVLNIKQRLDYKFGLGYEFFNDYDNRHKISYALIFRNGKHLNSYRYKYQYQSSILKGTLVFYLISPEEEIRGELSSEFKVFKALSFVVNHRYATKGPITNYMSTAGFKINY